MAPKKLTVWIFQTGEPLQSDGGNLRSMRAMNLSNQLMADGHKVVLWSSNFFHQEKRHRGLGFQQIDFSKNLKIKLIDSIGYAKNMGLPRLIDHFQLAVNLKKALRREKSIPDVAFIGYPPIEFAAVAVGWMKKNNVPTMLDVKDQWPDIFVHACPRIFRPIAKLIFLPYFYVAKKTIRNATAVSSMADGFLKWVRDFSCTDSTNFDGVFPLSPMECSFDDEAIKSAVSVWRKEIRDQDSFKFFFVGSFSQAFNFEPIRNAALRAEKDGLRWEFILCGDGDRLKEIQSLFIGLTNVKFPGRVNGLQIAALSELCIAAIAPYKNLVDFQKSIPNKVVDYLSLQQPIISPLKGEVKDLIINGKVGLFYDESDLDSLFNCLTHISSDKNLRLNISNNARQVYEDKFSYERVYGALSSRLASMAFESA